MKLESSQPRMKEELLKWGILIFGLALAVSVGVLFLIGANDTRIEVVSYVRRDRVIPLDQIRMRSMIIVAFRIRQELARPEELSVMGKLYLNDREISYDKVTPLDGSSGNVEFSIRMPDETLYSEQPFRVPDGKYTIELSLLDRENKVIVSVRKSLSRDEIARTFNDPEGDFHDYRFVKIANPIAQGEDGFRHGGSPKCGGNGIITVFQKGGLGRIYTQAVPDTSDCFDAVHIDISRNEYRSFTFGLRSIQDLGMVFADVVDLHGPAGNLKTDTLTVGAVKQLDEIAALDKKNRVARVVSAPRVIEKKAVSAAKNQTQAFWLTMKVSDDSVPGDYSGYLVIKSEKGPLKSIPLTVRVLPFRLADTDIQYGMMMDYAFYELDNNEWTEKDRTLLKQSGDHLYKDLREHGMTMIYPHSHFYYKTGRDGNTVLESLRASLKAYRELNFPGPFCWYLGHLLQTAKPKHPGSILGYDSNVAKRRLRDLLVQYEQIAGKSGVAKEKLIVQLVDEPDAQDLERVKAGKELHKVAREMGFKTLITRAWPDVDYICTGIPDTDVEANKLRSMGKQWWIYPNAALTGKNLSYTRYVFGFGAWRWGVNGVVPWTFQMTQGSNGNPFTVLDGPEVMVAYPGVNGPVPTPTWEVIREGINDYKYIHLLGKLISDQKSKGNPAALRIERLLQLFRKSLGKDPKAGRGQFGDWPPEAFESRREQIIEWALELYRSESTISYHRLNHGLSSSAKIIKKDMVLNPRKRLESKISG